LSLGFYICYLIIFEVHSVNSSYVEDNYFTSVRQENNFDLQQSKTTFKF
jgi:hypothetical protein